MSRETPQIGDRHNRLTLVASASVGRWIVRCDCGSQYEASVASVRSGGTKSCGCLRREVTSNQFRTHGEKRTKEYRAWTHARTRCYNQSCPDYPRYGGRGIKMSAAWDSFEQFLADMGRAPPGTSIDRIDNDGDYESGNCRWASAQTQVWNSRKVKMVEIAGKAVPCSEAERMLGVSPGRISAYAIAHAISHQQALGYYVSQKGFAA